MQISRREEAKSFFKILVKITRLYDYQTRQTHFGEIHEVRKGMWVSWYLDCAFQMLIGWVGKLWSRGQQCRVFCCSEGRCSPLESLVKLLFFFSSVVERWDKRTIVWQTTNKQTNKQTNNKRQTIEIEIILIYDSPCCQITFIYKAVNHS